MDWSTIILGCLFWAAIGTATGIGFGLWTNRSLREATRAWSDAVRKSCQSNKEWSVSLGELKDSLQEWEDSLTAQKVENHDDYLIVVSEPSNECGHGFQYCDTLDEVREALALLEEEVGESKYWTSMDVEVCVVLEKHSWDTNTAGKKNGE